MRSGRLAACSAAGAGRLAGAGRSVTRGGVVHQGDHLVGRGAGASVEVAELYKEGDAYHGPAGVLDEVAHRAGRAAGRQQVVRHEYAGALAYGVVVGFQGVGAVLKVVGGGDRLPRELVRLAGQDQAFSGPVGERGAEDEAAGLGGEDVVVAEVLGRGVECVRSRVEGLAVLYQG